MEQARRRVVVASGIEHERLKTARRVVAAGCVEDKRIKTVGRVVVAGCVAKRTSPRALKNKTRKFKG